LKYLKKVEKIMKIFLTGKPGCGKSTVLEKVVEILKKKGVKVGGFITPEIREEGKRVGFYVKDIFSGDVGLLASKDIRVGPRVGKYGVNVEEFERIALKALNFALKECEVIAIDEIGKMEMFSKKFKEEIVKLMLIDKPLVAVLHRNLVNSFKEYGEVIEVTQRNRKNLPREIVKKVWA